MSNLIQDSWLKHIKKGIQSKRRRSLRCIRIKVEYLMALSSGPYGKFHMCVKACVLYLPPFVFTVNTHLFIIHSLECVVFEKRSTESPRSVRNCAHRSDVLSDSAQES